MSLMTSPLHVVKAATKRQISANTGRSTLKNMRIAIRSEQHQSLMKSANSEANLSLTRKISLAIIPSTSKLRKLKKERNLNVKKKTNPAKTR